MSGLEVEMVEKKKTGFRETLVPRINGSTEPKKTKM